MNKTTGIGIGIAVVLVVGAIYGISESEFLKIENEKDTKIGFQDEVEFTVEHAEEESEFGLKDQVEMTVEQNIDVNEENQSGRVFNFTLEEKFGLQNP